MGNKNKKKSKNHKKRKPEKTEQSDFDNAPEEQTDNLGEPDGASEDENVESEKPQKRVHTEDESDSENEPKKKKKKKKPVNVEGASSDKKNKKSIRQLKKEKFAQRQAEAQAVAKDQLKSQCLSYLSQWKHDRTNWKFMKAKQVWLYKNKFSPSLVPNESWPLLMEYFESAKGNIRNMLLEDANKIIKQMDDWTESQNTGNEEEDKEEESDEPAESKKPDETVYKRARDLIQCLEEYITCFI